MRRKEKDNGNAKKKHCKKMNFHYEDWKNRSIEWRINHEKKGRKKWSP